jgi:hypothetical protein
MMTSCPALCGNRDHTLGWFALSCACLAAESVVDGVAQQMDQWIRFDPDAL